VLGKFSLHPALLRKPQCSQDWQAAWSHSPCHNRHMLLHSIHTLSSGIVAGHHCVTAVELLSIQFVRVQLDKFATPPAIVYSNSLYGDPFNVRTRQHIYWAVFTDLYSCTCTSLGPSCPLRYWQSTGHLRHLATGASSDGD
jgi:hypothetical protein